MLSIYLLGVTSFALYKKIGLTLLFCFLTHESVFLPQKLHLKDRCANTRLMDSRISAADESWGWEDSFQPVSNPKSQIPSSFSLPEGTRPASEYNWDSEGGEKHVDLFSVASQKTNQKQDESHSSDAMGDWGGDDNWESVEADQGEIK
ncbi:hypothetical protein AB205_0035780 [Aquarana catesbeiana]|uniref:Uncharacterized protein n=1 Tax=Aquarana catesbeiana TaxID=8400 RepID=A0A2G9S9B8_AQUCT|nr:hypothetical protein AB205_0035780 [Aquarana catesbeiana]